MTPNQHRAPPRLDSLKPSPSHHALDLHHLRPLHHTLLELPNLRFELLLTLNRSASLFGSELGRGGEDGDDVRDGRGFFEPAEEGRRGVVEGAVSGVLTGAEPPFTLHRNKGKPKYMFENQLEFPRDVGGKGGGWTYDEVGEEHAKESSVDTQDPAAILALDDPLRDRHDVFPLLRSIWVPVRQPVLSSHVVRQTTNDTTRPWGTVKPDARQKKEIGKGREEAEGNARFVGLCDLDKLGVGILSCLVLGDLEFIGMTIAVKRTAGNGSVSRKRGNSPRSGRERATKERLTI
jgi:hypothetical protein